MASSSSCVPKGMTARIGGEFRNFEKTKNKTIFMKMTDDCATNIKVLMIGPEDSCYQGGMFFFDVHLERYPQDPPKVKFTTPSSKERLHPNFYGCGKMCLSLINTWAENQWSPIVTLEKVFITIQALLDNNPICHEPGYDKEKITNQTARDYSIISRWLTLVTTLRWLKHGHPHFDKEMKSYFVENYKQYMTSLENLRPFDKQVFSSMHNSNIKIDFSSMKSQLEQQYNQLKC